MNGKYVGVVLSSAIVLGFAGSGCDRSASEPVCDDVPVKAQEAVKVESAAVKDAESAPAAEAPAWLGEFFGDKLVRTRLPAKRLEYIFQLTGARPVADLHRCL